MLAEPITLTMPTLLTLLRWQGGEPHTTLVSTPVWHDRDELAELDAQARAELVRLGLAGPDGLSGELTGTITALVHPSQEYYGWITDSDGTTTRVLAASDGRVAFVLTAGGTDGTVSITPARPAGLHAAFVARIPQLPAARGESVSVPKADYDDMLTTGSRTGSRELAVVAGLLREPRIGAGSLYSAVRRRTGTRHRVPHPLTYVDTRQGRWLTVVTTSSAREEWVTFAPASVDQLAARLREQHDQVARG